MTIEEAKAFLLSTGIFFYEPEDEEDPDYDPKWKTTINLNDVWGWAYADGYYVPDEEIMELYRLYQAYGWCGVLYHVSEKQGQLRSEFADVNRFIDFVRHEEGIIKEVPNSSRRAYHKIRYILGE